MVTAYSTQISRRFETVGSMLWVSLVLSLVILTEAETIGVIATRKLRKTTVSGGMVPSQQQQPQTSSRRLQQAEADADCLASLRQFGGEDGNLGQGQFFAFLADLTGDPPVESLRDVESLDLVAFYHLVACSGETICVGDSTVNLSENVGLLLAFCRVINSSVQQVVTSSFEYVIALQEGSTTNDVDRQSLQDAAEVLLLDGLGCEIPDDLIGTLEIILGLRGQEVVGDGPVRKLAAPSTTSELSVKTANLPETQQVLEERGAAATAQDFSDSFRRWLQETETCRFAVESFVARLTPATPSFCEMVGLSDNCVLVRQTAILRVQDELEVISPSEKDELQQFISTTIEDGIENGAFAAVLA